MGSQDSGVSVWLTLSARAVLVVKELFTHSVLDLAWSSDGLKLYACSYDGSIAEIEFEEQDFGKRIDRAEIVQRVEKAGRVRVVPPESYEILELEAKFAKETDDPMDRAFEQRITTQAATLTALPKPVVTPPRKLFSISQQAVTIDKDGKKRIKPVLVQASLPITSPSKQSHSFNLSNDNRENRSPDGKRLRMEDIGVTSYTLPTVQVLNKENMFKIPPVQKIFSTQMDRFGNLDRVEFKNNANGTLDRQLQAGCSEMRLEWINSF